MTILFGKLLLKAYNAGNSDNTIDYLCYLLDQSPNQRLLLFWDGASYHRSHLVQNFLGEINQGLSPEQWKIHCVRFAPNCPSQNPIEDIWLQAKTLVRQFLCFDFFGERQTVYFDSFIDLATIHIWIQRILLVG